MLDVTSMQKYMHKYMHKEICEVLTEQQQK